MSSQPYIWEMLRKLPFSPKIEKFGHGFNFYIKKQIEIDKYTNSEIFFASEDNVL
jgi:hypothetical protein